MNETYLRLATTDQLNQRTDKTPRYFDKDYQGLIFEHDKRFITAMDIYAKHLTKTQMKRCYGYLKLLQRIYPSVSFEQLLKQWVLETDYFNSDDLQYPQNPHAEEATDRLFATIQTAKPITDNVYLSNENDGWSTLYQAEHNRCILTAIQAQQILQKFPLWEQPLSTVISQFIIATPLSPYLKVPTATTAIFDLVNQTVNGETLSNHGISMVSLTDPQLPNYNALILTNNNGIYRINNQKIDIDSKDSSQKAKNKIITELINIILDVNLYLKDFNELKVVEIKETTFSQGEA